MRITLKAARVNKNLTQQQVADEVGVARETVGSWEKGKTMPDTDNVESLCKLYECSYDDIAWCN